MIWEQSTHFRQARVEWLFYLRTLIKKKKSRWVLIKKKTKTKKKTNQPTNQNDDAHASSDLVCMIVAVVVQPINNLQLIWLSIDSIVFSLCLAFNFLRRAKTPAHHKKWRVSGRGSWGRRTLSFSLASWLNAWNRPSSFWSRLTGQIHSL